MKSFTITFNVTIKIVAKDKKQALEDAFWQEFKAIDLVEFSGIARVDED